MKTDVRFHPYIAQFFLEWETIQTKFVEKVKTRIMCSITPPPTEIFAVLR